MIRKVLICTAAGVLATAVACSKSTQNPASPTSATAGADAAADGSTLKATTPTIVSPSGGGQVTDPVVLTASKATGKFGDISPSYQFQVRSGGTVVYDSGVVGGAGSGNNVTFTVPSSSLASDTDYTWRVRASYQGAVGSWSADGAFKSPVGAYIRGNELRDPLTIGSSVGQIVGPTQWIPGEGLKLLAHESHVTYQLPTTLTAGEFSLMVKGADEGTEGDKSKVFSMQQGFDDITTNAYRFTGELRGANYGGGAGSISCRMIAGDGVSRDCPRAQKSFDSSRWYFWKVRWDVGGSFTMEVRTDGPTGSVIYTSTQGLSGRTYRPNPHILYLGAPLGRAGALDATLPFGIYKNVYAGPGPRPNFPN
jgi:hypothetical protein